MLHLDADKKIPLYQQLYGQIKEILSWAENNGGWIIEDGYAASETVCSSDMGCCQNKRLPPRLKGFARHGFRFDAVVNVMQRRSA